MGVRLIVEVLDYAPASLTPRERYVLIVLAEGARDHTRVCWPGVEDDERFIHRSRLKSRSQRYAVLKALVEKGVLENVRRGQKGVRAGYRIAPMAPEGAALPPFQGPGIRDADGLEGHVQGPGNQDAESRNGDAQGPGFRDSGSRFSGFRVPDSGTPSPQSPQSPHPGTRQEAPYASSGDRRRRKTREEKNPVEIVMDATGATETEAAAVIAQLQAEQKITSLHGLLTTMARKGDLQAAVDGLRARRRPRATELCEAHTRRVDHCPFCKYERQKAAS
ncbi:hypothetical protein GCM10027294_25480 [Marinactinospora endophytica]